MKPLRLSRRAVLRGAGALIALPLLDVMLDGRGRLHDAERHDAALRGAAPRAVVPNTPPVCLVTWFFAHGTKMDSWTPSEAGPRWAVTPCLEPLAAHRDDLLLISGLANAAPELLSSVGGPHSRGAASWASGMPTTATGAGGPTFERRAAAELGGATRLRALSVVGAPETPSVESGSSAMLTNLSWAGPSRPAPALRDPATLFAALFGDNRDGADRSVLDHVRGDLAALRARVGRADRARVDEHLEAIRDMERAATPPDAVAVCAAGEAPSEGPFPAPERARLLLRLVATALRCDLTRFANFALSNAMDNDPMPWLNLGDGHHDLSHRDDHDTIVRITRDAMGHAAFFLDQLKAPDAHGRLLDRCLVFISSEVSDGAVHDYRNLPVIVAGRGGGVTPGSHLRVEPRTPICRLYLSLLQRAGSRADRFGLDGDAPLPLA